MKIVFANQKGGVGKSTLCTMFAHYLSDKEKDVQLIDMDFQKTLERLRKIDVNKSIGDIRQDEAAYDNPLRFTVEYANANEIESVILKADANKDTIYLFDAPGNVADRNVFIALSKADFIIAPFQYDVVSLDSTGVFIRLLEKMKIPFNIFFIPNKIDAREKLPFMDKTNAVLNSKGKVTPVVYLRSEMKKLSTITISKLQFELVKPAFDFIYNNLFV
jgi:chromosome partitioning protein